MNVRFFLLLSVLFATIALSGNAGKALAQTSPPAVADYGYVTKVPVAAPADPSMPQILEIDMNSQQLNAPGPLAIRVLTSTNVSAVYIHVEGQTFSVPLTENGRFELTTTLPTIPSAMKGRNYSFDFEAVTADQKRTHTGVPVFLAP